MWTLVQLWWGSGSFINPDTSFSNIAMFHSFFIPPLADIPYNSDVALTPWPGVDCDDINIHYKFDPRHVLGSPVDGRYWPNSIMTLFIRMSFAIKLRRDIITNLSISQTTSTARCYVRQNFADIFSGVLLRSQRKYAVWPDLSPWSGLARVTGGDMGQRPDQETRNYPGSAHCKHWRTVVDTYSLLVASASEWSFKLHLLLDSVWCWVGHLQWSGVWSLVSANAQHFQIL